MKKMGSISEGIRIRTYAVSVKVSLLLFVFLSLFLFTLQFRQKSHAIETKLSVDKEFLVNALKIGDLFFVTRYLSSFVESKAVVAAAIQEKNGEWVKIAPHSSFEKRLQNKAWSLGSTASTIQGKKQFEDSEGAQWTLYYLYQIEHSFLLLALFLSVFLSLLIFYMLRKLLISTAEFFTEPIENLSQDMDAQILRATDDFADVNYQKGHRFKETDQFVEELKRLIHEIGQQKDKVKEVEVLRALNKLSRQVNHDIQSPLGALKTALQQIDQSPQKAKQLMDKSIERIADIVADLKQKDSEPPQGHSIPKVTELNHFLGALIEEKSAEYKDQGLIIDFTSNATEVFVEIDQSGWARALSNLINNGIEAVDSRTPQIKLRVLKQQEEVVVEVEDNGRGLSGLDSNKIFSYGFSANKLEGSGLGLTQAQEVIHQAGGHISVASTSDQGSVFKIVLPLK